MLKQIRRLMICKIGCLVLFGLMLPLVAAAGQEGGDKVDFAKLIKPIFEKHCISCHGPTEAENFRIDVVDEAMDYIEGGASDESDIYLSLVSDDEEVLMPPPDEQNPLSAEQIQLVKAWIDEGADWPVDVQLVEPAKEIAEVVAGECKEAETVLNNRLPRNQTGYLTRSVPCIQRPFICPWVCCWRPGCLPCSVSAETSS